MSLHDRENGEGRRAEEEDKSKGEHAYQYFLNLKGKLSKNQRRTKLPFQHQRPEGRNQNQSLRSHLHQPSLRQGNNDFVIGVHLQQPGFNKHRSGVYFH